MKFSIESVKNYGRRHKLDLSKFMVYIILLLTLVFFSAWLGGTFFSMTNVLNIFRQTGMIAIMAIGMTFVLGTGEIDLSVSGVVPMSGIISAYLLEAGVSLPIAIIVSLLFGIIVGLLSGAMITAFQIPAFLLTLGMQNILRGIGMWVTGTKAVPIYNTTFNKIFGSTDIFGRVPTLLLWLILILLLGFFAMNYLPFGKRILAIGGNRQAAAYSGVKVKREIIIAFMISGLCAALAGLMYAGRTGTARYTFGQGDEMNIIAGVVLGGTAMNGGKASIVGAVVGALLMGIINNGLIVGGLDVSQQMVVKGAIIIIAVALNNVGNIKQSVKR